MTTTIFLTTLGVILLAVGIVYSVKAWKTRPVLTAEQNAQRIADGYSPITAPMLVSGLCVVAGLFVTSVALLPLVIH